MYKTEDEIRDGLNEFQSNLEHINSLHNEISYILSELSKHSGAVNNTQACLDKFSNSIDRFNGHSLHTINELQLQLKNTDEACHSTMERIKHDINLTTNEMLLTLKNRLDEIKNKISFDLIKNIDHVSNDYKNAYSNLTIKTEEFERRLCDLERTLESIDASQKFQLGKIEKQNNTIKKLSVTSILLSLLSICGFVIMILSLLSVL